jgi:hypothetical protein
MSAEPTAGEGAAAPPTPAPAGVVDLGRYRGRTDAARAVVPPPRSGPTDDGSGVRAEAGAPPPNRRQRRRARKAAKRAAKARPRWI